MQPNDWKDKLLDQKHALAKYRQHWLNNSPAGWLSKESRDALENKLTRVGVNWPRLVVQSVSERLDLKGFRERGSNDIDNDYTRLLDRVNLRALQKHVHVDYLLYGSAYGTAWTAANGRPIFIADSPMTASAVTDPATGEVLESMRSWRDNDGLPCMAVIDAETIRVYRSNATDDIANVFSWDTIEHYEHGLGAVPTVPFIRQESSDDLQGTSIVADILDLTDANSKALGDAMVSSEFFAKPRRYATGLEIQEDEDGTPLDPFGAKRLLQSEDPETKFGQLPAQAPTGQSELISTITQQIGALTGLPPHYLGLHGDQPASAEGVRAAETQLVARSYGEQGGLSRRWAEVAGRLHAIDQGVPYEGVEVAVVWQPAESKTPAQAADAAMKLRTIGVPLETLLANPLDYEPHEIREIVKSADNEAGRQALANMSNLAPGGNV